jgi:hypothetical protein
MTDTDKRKGTTKEYLEAEKWGRRKAKIEKFLRVGKGKHPLNIQRQIDEYVGRPPDNFYTEGLARKKR